MSDQPTVSVVIPSLNQGRYLRRCLESIITQGHAETEIIVIDGGSTDETSDILAEFDPRIAYRVSEADTGQSDALNKGFDVATGDILCWLNSDDYFLDGAFDSILDAFERSPETTVVYGDWLEVDEGENLIIRRYALDFSVREAQYRAFSALAQAMFWKREVHDRFGSFPLDIHQGIDNYMILRFILTEEPTRFIRLPIDLAAFRRHEMQKTGHLDRSTRNEQRRAEELEIDRALDLVPRDGLGGRFERTALTVRRSLRLLRRGGPGYLIRFLHLAATRRFE